MSRSLKYIPGTEYKYCACDPKLAGRKKGMVVQMKTLKCYIFIGIIFVLTVGSLSHFVYQWSGNNYIAGFFSPVSESVWEHMKLLYFPMLFYSSIVALKLRKSYPCMIPSLCFGLLAGTALIPILFYTYTSILGKNTLLLDIGVFALSTVLAFYAVYRFTLSCRLNPYAYYLYVFTGILFLCFLFFTYHSPDTGIFSIPHPDNSSISS